METTSIDHHQKETTSHHHIPTKLESLQTKLECLQHMTTCRPPWAKINKFMELQSKGRSPPAPPAEGTTTFETSRPTWVSDKDVALNKPKQGHKPNQSIPERSHFYRTHKQARKMSLLLLLCLLLTCHFLDTKRCGWVPHIDIFLSTFTKNDQKRMSSQKVFTSGHGLFVQISLSVWKNWKHFKH
jgi:hypothetical protein